MHDLTRRDLIVGAASSGLAPTLLTSGPALAQGTPKRGGTLTTILTPEPPILILGVNNQGPTSLAAGKLFQGLLEYSFKLEPMPLLAKLWSLSDDKKTYTFKLQDNVKFHDGHPMTADDVIFSITKFHTELSPRARPIFSKIKEATAPDPHTVVLTLETPFEPFLLMFDVSACAIVPKHIYDGTDYRTNPANQHPIGTGPFQFVEWQRGNFVRMKRFDDYWVPGQPYLDEIIYRIIPDSQSRALALETGQVQLTQSNDIEPFDVPRFRAMPNLETELQGWEYASQISWIEVNHRVKPLDDVRVRQAISHALDRNFILGKLWFGIGKAGHRPDRLHHAVLRSPGREAAGIRPEQGQGTAGRGRIEAQRQGRPVHHQTARAAVRRSVDPPGRIFPHRARPCRHRGGTGDHRRRRLGQADRRLGLRDQHQLPVAVRRSDAGRGTQLHLQQHQEDHLHQHRRLQQPEGGSALHHRA